MEQNNQSTENYDDNHMTLWKRKGTSNLLDRLVHPRYWNNSPFPLKLSEISFSQVFGLSPSITSNKWVKNCSINSWNNLENPWRKSYPTGLVTRRVQAVEAYGTGFLIQNQPPNTLYIRCYCRSVDLSVCFLMKRI